MKRRILSIITALALCLSLCPAWALAAEADPSLCKHHPAHTEDCGYAAPTEGQPCGHEHTEDCYITDEAGGEVLDCHHSHDSECGYVQADPGTSCGYVCNLCPIEDLIAALPEQVTEDNAADVRGQLDHILALFGELNEDEQEEINLSRCYALQAALDEANAPMTANGSTEQQDTDEASVEMNGTTTYYATLEEAFTAVNGQTATITMLTNAECSKETGSNSSPLVISGGKVTLNLNEKTLSGKGSGYHGIIDVTGGSLLVQGEEGKVNVTMTGLSCRGSGKLTVEGITLELVGDNIGVANAGVENSGGTVVLNGTQITGAAADGQIYHYSGTTTINNVTATGTTEKYPKSVWYDSEGTLKINGGTFDKIVVNNYDNAPTIAGLLGEGCAYKKQGGTWATDDELAGLEISNVTVAKIPLTIHPQGDTSWYYSTQQTHTLAMNAAPVDSGNSVSYVWKSGEETLDCTSDAYTVPAGTPVGSYTYTCEATCDDYTLSHTFTFKIEKSGTDLADGKIKTYNGETETTSFSADDTITVKATPTATGAAPATAAMLTASLDAPSEGQMAVFVGDTQVSEPVDAVDGSYTMTVSAADVLLAAGGPGTEIPLTARFTANDNMADGAGTVKVNITAVAVAEKDGKVIGYYGESNLDDAFTNDSATVTLLANVERTNTLTIKVNCTLDLGGHNITFTGTEYVWVQGPVTAMTIRGEGEIISEQSHALVVIGSVTLEGGTFTSNGGNSAGVYVNSAGASLSVTGEYVTIRNTGGGYGLAVNLVQSVQLSAGTYKGEKAVSIVSGTTTLGDLLAHSGDTRYAYFDESGTNPIAGVLSNTSLTGTVTVKACQHTGVEATNNNDGTHSVNCPYCGFENAAEPYDFDETGLCPACKLQAAAKVEKSGSDTAYVEASGLADVFAEDSGNDGATITLLDNITTSKQINVYTDNLTLDLNGKTYTCTQNDFHLSFVSLTIKGSGAITTSGYYCLTMDGGTLNIESGSFSAKDSAVYVENNGRLQLTGGSFTGNQNAIAYASGEVKDALKNYGGAGAPHYAFYQGSSPYAPSGRSLPSGTFTVGTCEHDGVPVQDLGSGKHGLDCPYCGYHSEHTTTLTATVSGNTVTFRGGCDSCDYRAENLATAAFTIPKLTYGQTGQTVSCTWEHPNGYALMVQIDSGEELQIDVSDTQVSLPLKQLFGSQEINAGNYQLHVYCRSYADVTSNVCSLPVTVEKAPLTPSITGTATKPYDGTTDVAAGQLSITLTGAVDGDTVTATASYAYDNANAGENKTITASGITLGGADAGNYQLSRTTAATTGTITKANVTLTATPAANPLTYNGTAQALISAGTASVGKVVYSLTDTGTYSTTIPTGTDAGSYTVWYKVEGTTNYEGTDPVKVDVTIAKVNYTGEKASSTSGKFGMTKTYDLKNLLPEGYVLGIITTTDTNSIFEGTPTVSGTTLTYKLADSAEAGKTGTITIPVTESTNYNSFDLTITVTVTNVRIPDLTVNPISVTYTGSPVSSDKITGTATVDGNTVLGTWSFVSGQNLTNVADSGAKSVVFNPTNTSEYGPATGTVTVTIRKATPSLSLTPSPATLPNGGTVTLTLSGLPSGGSATVTCSDENITVTKGSGDTWTAELPAGGASYTFTASYSGDGNHNGASANCTVSVEKITPTLSLTANPASLRGGGAVTLTLSGLPTGGTAAVTCSGGITVTAGAGSTWTATLPNSTATYTFTASYAGNASYHGASASCTVETTEVTVLPNPPEAEDGKQYQVVMEDGISEVPAGLQSIETLNTPEKLETAMKTAITQANSGVPQANTAVYDVELQISADGGATWTKATAANFPANGLTVTLPYPAGTNSSYTFTVVHMFTTSDFGKTPGDTETPRVTNTASGLQFTVSGLSPISVGWVQSSSSGGGSGSSGAGGDGGGWSSSTYAVTVERAEHGKVTSNRTNASSGSTVTLTATPDSGYELDTLTVTDSRGNAIRLAAQGGGKYTFTMPSRAVTVKAAFAPLPDDTEKPCDGSANCPSHSFTDLGAVGTWYHEAVDYVLRNNLMGGYGNGLFGPNDTLTRAQFAQILYNKEGRPAVTGSSSFSDVAPGAWCAPAITWAAERGIIGGYGNGMFGPNGNITREQLAVMLWRYAGSPAATDEELHFNDADKASGYALDALRWAVENGIINGYGNGQLAPQGLATRAQVAQMLMNFLKNK